jgi:hypothetical protein
VTRRRCCPLVDADFDEGPLFCDVDLHCRYSDAVEPTQDIDGTLVDNGQQHGHRVVTRFRSESFRDCPGPAGQAENRCIKPSSKVVDYEGDTAWLRTAQPKCSKQNIG